MTAPGVISPHASRTRTRRLQRAAKIREGESRNVIAHALGRHLVIERAHRLAQLRQQTALRTRRASSATGVCRVGAGLVSVRVVTAKRTEEDLTLHSNTDRVFDLDQLCDLLQLIPQRGSGELGQVTGRWNRRICLVQSSIRS